jgi:DNA (cytosine-5)-methyltransferase 1
LNELALFAGVCGGLLADKLDGHRIVCYVEWNKYCVEVIKARIRDGYLDDAPIWDDCNTFDGYPWAGYVDCISAGFPCQPFSLVGKRLGQFDPRNGWPATRRIIGEIRPALIKLENVPGLISNFYIRRIFGDLAELGYDAEWGCLSAGDIGAPHKRKRLWIFAYSNSRPSILQQFSRQNAMESPWNGIAQSMANPNEERFTELQLSTFPSQPTVFDRSSHEIFNSRDSWSGFKQACKRSQEIRDRNSQWWKVEPGLGRVADGVAHRMDRLAAIGNGQVPAVALTAYKLLKRRI